ncbi:MAG: hypothetical protein ACYTAF_08025, partial [Planctomycetota bacterium]
MPRRTRRTRKQARGLSTASAHAGGELPSRTKPLSPSLHLSSVHEFGSLDLLHQASSGRSSDWFYRRYG